MADKRLRTATVADAYIALLADRGIDYIFANAGSDFTPIIEALAKAQSLGTPAPKPLAVPHENVAMAIAMGNTMVSGKPQLVMVHTNVGTANALCQMLNTNRLNLPMIVASGRSPYAEDRVAGGRSIDIHWTQEMFDQAGMVREAVKWDYELRDAGQLEAVIDRAIAIATTLPKGPVYLSLPREVLAQSIQSFEPDVAGRHVSASVPHPDPASIDRLADAVFKAERPVIVTSQLGNQPNAVDAVSVFAERWAIPVTQYRPRTMNLPTGHAMHMGYDPGEFIGEADLILAVECEVPWIPRLKQPPADCMVAHLAGDPIYQTSPHRGFRADFAITGEAEQSLRNLKEALDARGGNPGVNKRRKNLISRRAETNARLAAEIKNLSNARPISQSWLSKCLSDVIDDDSIVMREAALDLRYLTRRNPSTLFSGASGLGWGLGGAIGAKLAKPDVLVVACEGDGAYMFGNPVSAHYFATAHNLPFLTVIFNNQRWESVHRATRAMYPDGFAVKSNNMPLTTLAPSPEFEKVVEASGGYGTKVEDPAELPKVLERVVSSVMDDRRQAVLNVHCGD